MHSMPDCQVVRPQKLCNIWHTCEKQPSCAATRLGRPVAPAPSSTHLAPLCFEASKAVLLHSATVVVACMLEELRVTT